MEVGGAEWSLIKSSEADPVDSIEGLGRITLYWFKSVTLTFRDRDSEEENMWNWTGDRLATHSEFNDNLWPVLDGALLWKQQ